MAKKGLTAAVVIGVILAGTHSSHGHGGLIPANLLATPATSDGSPAANERLGNAMAARGYGWTGSQATCLDVLWQGESGWRANADTRVTGLDPWSSTVWAYGIPQARPAQKMATAGADWQTNPVTQIKWGLGYIASTYGSPCSALAFKQSHGNQGY